MDEEEEHLPRKHKVLNSKPTIEKNMCKVFLLIKPLISRIVFSTSFCSCGITKGITKSECLSGLATVWAASCGLQWRGREPKRWSLKVW
jgi:hypothetical protein